MSLDTDQMFQKYLELEPLVSSSLNSLPNESDTRLKVLDRFLFELLGWRHESVFTEPPSPSGYIDYLLTIGEKRAAVVIEAKRAGLLRPDTASQKSAVLSLSGPVIKPMLDGIKQALAYATDQGAPVAVLTDGHCWLFFKASRTDGLRPLDGKGILFPCLSAIKEDFSRFVELLALPYILDRRHIAHLNIAEGHTVGEAEEHFFVFNPNEAKMIQRSSLAHDASLLFSQFFSRLSNIDNKEMMSACFVETSESKKADFELQKIVQNVLNGISSLDTTEGSALQAEIERTLRSLKSETVLLVGNKGSGKSTFIDRFFSQTLLPSIREKCVIARIDLGHYSGAAAGIIEWAIHQLRETLEIEVCSRNPPSFDQLQGIFWSEYVRWREGANKPLYEKNKEQFKIDFGKHMEERREKFAEEYVRLLLNRAAIGLKRLPCIVFDNTDQFPAEVQDSIYQLAHSLESAAPVFIVVPITDRTVWRLCKAGALQSYASKSFYLPVPEAKEILYRRVRFVNEKLQDERSSAAAYFSKKGFQVSLDDLSMFAQAVERIFIESDNISGLIGRLGNFDIRRMLRLAERIFVSPSINIEDIMKSHYGGPSLASDRLRTHKALIRGEYDRFSEFENEYVSNIFFTDPHEPTSPLLAFYILWILRQRSVSVRNDNVEARHWLVSEVGDFFEGCGVKVESTLNVVKRLYDRRLIETLDPNIAKLSYSDRIAIKESGLAHIELIISSPVYFQQMAMTTGLIFRETRDEIKHRVHGRTRQTFLEIRDIFINYLLKVDAARFTIPIAQQYRQLNEARAFIRDAKVMNRPLQRSGAAEFKKTPSNLKGSKKILKKNLHKPKL